MSISRLLLLLRTSLAEDRHSSSSSSRGWGRGMRVRVRMVATNGSSISSNDKAMGGEGSRMVRSFTDDAGTETEHGYEL